MNKRGKPISFGKIKINLASASTSTGGAIENEVAEGGFGTFNQRLDQTTGNDDQETENMKEMMGFSGFGKKAKQFNIEEMMERAKKTIEEKKCQVCKYFTVIIHAFYGGGGYVQCMYIHTYTLHTQTIHTVCTLKEI
jgi:hypothetical protein